VRSLDPDLWNGRYEVAFNEAKRIINTMGGIITAFNVNIDALHFLRRGEVEMLLSTRLLEETESKLRRLPYKIATPSDFLSGLISCLKNGRGAEWLIYNLDVFSWLGRNFSQDKLLMGGQAGNTANALANLGAPCVYPHVTQLPRIQAEMFSHTDNIKVPVPENGDVRFNIPLEAVRPKDKPMIHWIFEFKQGDRIRLGAQEFRSPIANRFIATWDEANAWMKLDPAFEKGSLKVVRDVDKAMISGYHLLRTAYPNGSTFDQHVERTVSLISKWKKVNPNLKIHYEQTFLKEREILRSVIAKVFPHAQAIGTNEDELANVLDVCQYSELASRIRSVSSASNLYEGACILLRLLNFSRVIVHTRDFILSLVKSDYRISPEKEQLAVLFGAAVAAARALTGRFADLDAVQGAIRSAEMRLSERGLAEHRDLAERLKVEGVNPERFLMTGIAEMKDHTTVFAVTKIMDDPSSTVGLGDSLVAGILIGETED